MMALISATLFGTPYCSFSSLPSGQVCRPAFPTLIALFHDQHPVSGLVQATHLTPVYAHTQEKWARLCLWAPRAH